MDCRGDWVNAAAFSPDGRWLVTGSRDSSARLWDLTARNLAAASSELRGHRGAILTAAFSPDSPDGTGSRWLATASGDGSARLWPLRQEVLPDPAQAQRGPGGRYPR